MGRTNKDKRAAAAGIMASIDALKAEYDRLAVEAAGFEKASREFVKRAEAEFKAWHKNRAREKTELMAAKREAFIAWHRAAENAGRPVTHEDRTAAGEAPVQPSPAVPAAPAPVEPPAPAPSAPADTAANETPPADPPAPADPTPPAPAADAK